VLRELFSELLRLTSSESLILDLEKFFIFYTKILFLAVPSLQPLNQSIYVGKNAVFECLSENPISWGFSGKIFPSNVEIRGTQLLIHKIRINNRGIYNCTTKDSGGREYNLQGKLCVLLKRRKSKFF